MRCPRLRMSVRRLMIVVAMIAILLVMRQISAIHHKRADAYASLTFHTGDGYSAYWNGRWVARSDPTLEAHDARAWKMAEKYWGLSDYPWMPFVPDEPPPPEARAAVTETWEPPMELGLTVLPLRPTSPPAWTFLWTWRP